MSKLEQNALQIAELMGKEVNQSNIMNFCYIADYSNYQKLMPIVFKSKKTQKYTINILAVSVVFGIYDSMNEFETIHGKSFETDSEESFIEAIQECVIKYLELKND